MLNNIHKILYIALLVLSTRMSAKSVFHDANGERVYKLMGTSNLGQVNSGSMKAQAIFDDAVLYPNPYMVVTPKGYTKHYYAGTERLATVIGGGGFDDMTQSIDPLSSQHDWDIVDAFYKQYLNFDPFRQERLLSTAIPTEDIAGVQYPELAYNCQPMLLEHIYILPKQDILQSAIAQNSTAYRQENEAYFYHGDHLGSAHWITDGGGMPIQYIHYAPYGELITNQAPYGYDERYKFTGKERDSETGYDYYPARFLWSDAGIWLSVDPLADKYPWIMPYAYCNWNPIKNIDPDGREPNKVIAGTSNDFKKLLDHSTNKVGLYKGETAINYMMHVGDYEFKKFKIMPAQTGFFNNKKGRYIYTKKGGWIDMVHFMFYAGRAFKYKQNGNKNPINEAILDGYIQEMQDLITARHSAYSYEDLPSDKFGAIFGSTYFDPDSQLSLGEQIKKFLDDYLQAANPDDAPNYSSIPEKDGRDYPSSQNKTTQPIFFDEN